MAYTENVREQYIALGKFIAAFERMVDLVRTSCIGLLEPNLNDQKLVEVIFHHQVLTAQPLFDILRALIFTTINDRAYIEKHSVTEKEQNDINGVLTTIASSYMDLLKKRNNLLHATWQFGHPIDPFADPINFKVSKRTVTKTGLSRVLLPNDVKGLDQLRIRCEATTSWIWELFRCLPHTVGKRRVHDSFKFVNGRWERTWPSRSTLPRVFPEQQ
jgi:hypothetical protein